MVALTKAKRRIASAGEDARDRVAPVAESALGSLAAALEEARERVGPAFDEAKGRIGPALDEAKGRIGPTLDEARGRISPVLDEAKGRLTPAIEEAKERIRPALHDARQTLVPVAHKAMSGGKRKGRRAAAKLHLVEEPKQGHQLRSLLGLLVMSGVGLILYKLVFGRHDDWSDAAVGASSHGTSTATTGVPDQPAGSSEQAVPAPTAPLASEEAVASPEPTTPDAPLEERQLEQG